MLAAGPVLSNVWHVSAAIAAFRGMAGNPIRAFTRRLVILISSSSVVKAHCSEASLISCTVALRYVTRHDLITAPPWAAPNVSKAVFFEASCAR